MQLETMSNAAESKNGSSATTTAADAPAGGSSAEATFGKDTPALDVIKGYDLSKKVAIVTVSQSFKCCVLCSFALHHVALNSAAAILQGASAGIGVETARALAHAKAHVILAVRSLDKVFCSGAHAL